MREKLLGVRSIPYCSIGTASCFDRSHNLPMIDERNLSRNINNGIPYLYICRENTKIYGQCWGSLQKFKEEALRLRKQQRTINDSHHRLFVILSRPKSVSHSAILGRTLMKKPLKWRRGWDSNPRYAHTYNGFRDRPVRPLRHPSLKDIRLEDSSLVH